jgi:hypothetical protein
VSWHTVHQEVAKGLNTELDCIYHLNASPDLQDQIFSGFQQHTFA